MCTVTNKGCLCLWAATQYMLLYSYIFLFGPHEVKKEKSLFNKTCQCLFFNVHSRCWWPWVAPLPGKTSYLLIPWNPAFGGGFFFFFFCKDLRRMLNHSFPVSFFCVCLHANSTLHARIGPQWLSELRQVWPCTPWRVACELISW